MIKKEDIRKFLKGFCSSKNTSVDSYIIVGSICYIAIITTLIINKINLIEALLITGGLLLGRTITKANENIKINSGKN